MHDYTIAIKIIVEYIYVHTCTGVNIHANVCITLRYIVRTYARMYVQFFEEEIAEKAVMALNNR